MTDRKNKRKSPSPIGGEPYYCAVCGVGYAEYVACERPDCRLETPKDAAARDKLAEDIFNGSLS